MTRKRLFGKNIPEAKHTGVTIPARDGSPWMAFSPAVATSLRRMVSRLQRDGSFPPAASLVASLRQEGVTYVSRALGAVLAEDLEESVCVVELNWYWPSTLTETSPGIAAVLSGELPLDEAILPTGNDKLAFLPAGQLPAEKRPRCARSTDLRDILSMLALRYDHILLDTPSILSTADAVPLASLAPACCLVVHQGVTPISDIHSAMDEIDHLNILGVVMNKVHLSVPAAVLKIIAQ